MEPEIEREVQETVIDILKNGDLGEMTEYEVRVAASDRLGIDLTDAEHKKFIRGVVESFLVSTTMEAEAGANVREETEEVVGEDEGVALTEKETDCDGNPIICKASKTKPLVTQVAELSNRRNVSIQDFRGTPLVSIREFYMKDGKQLPSCKGISMTTEQWSVFKKSVPSIEETIVKLQSRLRSGVNSEQNVQVKPATVPTPAELVPIELNRFDGKNYQHWASQVELFLKQLKLEYVLSDPCPSLPTNLETSPEEIELAKAAQQKWFNDDYLCRHNILNSLSDSLYYQYHQKSKNAKELWEELRLVYIYEEFGTKRAQVKRYIEFQFVDDKPILSQVQEFNSIADAIVANGMFIDENFHVSAVISKFPLSWKNFCIKLMQEDHLPTWVLMDRVRREEESRNWHKQGRPSNSASFHHAKNLGPRMRDVKKQNFCCDFCGKKGHIAKHCHNRKFGNYTGGKSYRENTSAWASIGGENATAPASIAGENASASASIAVNMEDCRVAC